MPMLLLRLLLTALLGAVLVVLIQRDRGYLLVSWDGWVLESSIWVGLALLLLLLGAGYLLWRLASGTQASRRWWRQRRERRDQLRLHAALEAWAAGRHRVAIRRLARLHDDPQWGDLALRLSLQAYQRLGDLRGAEALLPKRPSTDPLRQQLEAQWALQQQDLETAQAGVEALLAKQGDDPAVLQLALQLYQQQHNLLAVLNLLPTLAKLDLMPDDRQLQVLFTDFLQRAATDYTALDRAWQSLPRHLRQQPALVARYGDSLQQRGASDQAEKLWRAVLEQQLDTALLARYAQLELPADGLLKTLQRWRQRRGDDAGLLAAMAQLAMRCELWGQAREYWQQSLALQPTVEGWAQLARLLDALGEARQAAEARRASLQVAVGELPTLPLPRHLPNRSGL